MPHGDLVKTERIGFRVEGVPVAGPKCQAWRDALKHAAVEAKQYVKWVGLGPLACYIRLVARRPRVPVDPAALAGQGIDPGSAHWNTSRDPVWVFSEVLRLLGPYKKHAGILWDDITQICFPIADIRVCGRRDKPHTVVVVTELPPIDPQDIQVAVNIRGLQAEVDSWSIYGKGVGVRKVGVKMKGIV